jgi:peptidoglycan hydrolase-like protein with peptidoglycan-binding domain
MARRARKTAKRGVVMSKSVLFSAAAVIAFTGAMTGQAFAGSASPMMGLPQGAQTGECYARIMIPAQYDMVVETVVVEEGYEAIDVTQPQFGNDVQNVVVKDAGIRYVVRQPRYEIRPEQVMVRPAYERLFVTPAQYDYVSQTIQVGESRFVWKPGRNLSGVTRVDPNSGEVYCLVEEPGQTVTVQKRVIRSPEVVRREMVPAQSITVHRQVMVDPGGVDQVPVPAEYRAIPIQTLVAPAQQVSRPIAPKTRTVEKKVLRSPERFEWAPVICDTNASPQNISQLQSALAARGYYTGPIDGRLGAGTMAGLERFQRENGLSVHVGYVTLETLRLLGIEGMAGPNAGSFFSGSRTEMLQGGHVSYAPSAGGHVVMQGGASSSGAMAAAGYGLVDELAGGQSYVAPQPAPVAQPVAAQPARTQFTQDRKRLDWAGKR